MPQPSKSSRPKAPSKPSSDLPENFWAILIAISVLVVSGLLIYVWVENAEPRPLRAMVVLDNRCEIIDDAFIAVAEPEGNSAVFVKRVAYLDTTDKSKILVRVNPKYPGFQFESSKSDAAPRVTIRVNCDAGDRTQRTLDAMKEQFKSK